MLLCKQPWMEGKRDSATTRTTLTWHLTWDFGLALWAARAFWEWHTAHCSSPGSLNLRSPPSPQLIPTTLLGKHLCSFPIFTQSGDAWSWGKERAEWVRWLFLASLYRLKPMRTFLCVQVAIHGITVPATFSTQAWPVYLSVWCPTLPSFRRLIDWLSLSLLTTQVQWPNNLWTIESYENRVCKTSMHVISESCMSWKW